MLIRTARFDDLEILTDYSCRLCLETEGRAPDPARVKAGLSRILQHDDWFILVAEEDDVLVGEVTVAGSEWCEWSNGLFLWATSLYVLPAFRSKGVTRALIEALDARAMVMPDVIGIRGASLASNVQAHSALAKLGREPNGYVVIENRFDQKHVENQPDLTAHGQSK